MDILCFENINEKQSESQYGVFLLNANEIYEKVRILDTFKRKAFRIKYVESAYEEFSSYKVNPDNVASIDLIALERKARAFFIEFSIFLVRWKKTFEDIDDKGTYKKRYEQITHDAYDQSDSYAKACLLRNHTEHYADLIEAVSWDSKGIYASFNKKTIMDNKGFSQTKKKKFYDESENSNYVNLKPIMEQALKKLQEIQDIFLYEIINEDVLLAINTLSDINDKMKDIAAKRWFFIYENDNNTIEELMNDPDEHIKHYAQELYPIEEYKQLIPLVRRLTAK